MGAKKFRKPYRLRKKKSIFRNRFFWLGILIVLIICAILYFLFFSETFQVEKINITGGGKIPNKDIRPLVEEKLERNILPLKTRSIFLVNLGEIKNNILRNFPQISRIEINRGFPDAINIVVEERSAQVIFCQEDKCFLTDGEGVIFEDVPTWTDLPKIVDKRNQGNFSLGEKVIEKEIVNQVLEIKENFAKNQKISNEDFFLLPDKRLNLKTSENWEIYFDLKGDINWQLTELNLVLEKEIPPEKRGNLEYIDLRFSKVYYKYKTVD